MSDNGRLMVAVTAGYSQVYVWEAEPQEDVMATSTNQVKGTWSEVKDTKVSLPGRANFDAMLSVQFCVKEV